MCVYHAAVHDMHTCIFLDLDVHLCQIADGRGLTGRERRHRVREGGGERGRERERDSVFSEPFDLASRLERYQVEDRPSSIKS